LLAEKTKKLLHSKKKPFWNSSAADESTHLWKTKFICGRWFSSTREDLKNSFYWFGIHFFFLCFVLLFACLGKNLIINKLKICWKNSFFLKSQPSNMDEYQPMYEYCLIFILSKLYIIYVGKLSTSLVGYHPQWLIIIPWLQP
jgi:hypothetical protein